jgi:hypothetical protein
MKVGVSRQGVRRLGGCESESFVGVGWVARRHHFPAPRIRVYAALYHHAEPYRRLYYHSSSRLRGGPVRSRCSVCACWHDCTCMFGTAQQLQRWPNAMLNVGTWSLCGTGGCCLGCTAPPLLHSLERSPYMAAVLRSRPKLPTVRDACQRALGSGGVRSAGQRSAAVIARLVAVVSVPRGSPPCVTATDSWKGQYLS